VCPADCLTIDAGVPLKCLKCFFFLLIFQKTYFLTTGGGSIDGGGGGMDKPV
jgi:hypothetical protein